MLEVIRSHWLWKSFSDRKSWIWSTFSEWFVCEVLPMYALNILSPDQILLAECCISSSNRRRRGLHKLDWRCCLDWTPVAPTHPPVPSAEWHQLLYSTTPAPPECSWDWPGWQRVLTLKVHLWRGSWEDGRGEEEVRTRRKIEESRERRLMKQLEKSSCDDF